jgi:excisionase family DNA binding protein
MNEKYFKVSEVAKQFRVSRQTVYDWISEGRLRAVKIGRVTRIPESALSTLISEIKPGENTLDNG